jgi:hypothetical protein
MVAFVTDTQQVFEYACHDGNFGLGNILGAVRAKEKQDEERTNRRREGVNCCSVERPGTLLGGFRLPFADQALREIRALRGTLLSV